MMRLSSAHSLGPPPGVDFFAQLATPADQFASHRCYRVFVPLLQRHMKSDVRVLVTGRRLRGVIVVPAVPFLGLVRRWTRRDRTCEPEKRNGKNLKFQGLRIRSGTTTVCYRTKHV